MSINFKYINSKFKKNFNPKVGLIALSTDQTIEGDFNIYMVSQREPHNIATTALYEVGNNTCRVYCKKRAFVDCMRSIAHEMTHMMQDQMGILTGHIRDAGGFHEDQANAKAGELIKLFAKSRPHRKTIYENKTILSKRILFN